MRLSEFELILESKDLNFFSNFDNNTTIIESEVKNKIEIAQN